MFVWDSSICGKVLSSSDTERYIHIYTQNSVYTFVPTHLTSKQKINSFFLSLAKAKNNNFTYRVQLLGATEHTELCQNSKGFVLVNPLLKTQGPNKRPQSHISQRAEGSHGLSNGFVRSHRDQKADRKYCLFLDIWALSDSHWLHTKHQRKACGVC